MHCILVFRATRHVEPLSLEPWLGDDDDDEDNADDYADDHDW